MLWTVAFRLEVTGWTLDLNRVELLVTIGALLGALLGLSSFQRATVKWMGAAFSIFFLSWQLGSLSGDELLWVKRLTEIGVRINDAFLILVRNEPIRDTILFLLVMAILFWFIGLTSGYMLMRYGKPWIPLVIAAMTLFIVDYNSPYLEYRYRYTGIFVLLMLLMLGRLYFLRSSCEWDDQGISMDYETGYSLGRSMVIGGLLVVVMAWNIPALIRAFNPESEVQQQFSNTWSDLRERLANIVAGLESPVTYVSDEAYNSLELGRGAVLGDELLFSVVTNRQPESARFYWRGYSYDTYTGDGWQNTLGERTDIEPDEWPLPFPVLDGRQRVNFRFNLNETVFRSLYAPAMILTFDRPAQYIAQDIGNGHYDVIAVLAEPILEGGETFDVLSYVADPTVNELRNAGEEYPDWVLQTYLEMPEDMEERFRAKALEIIGDADTPYDRVEAITQFLRREIEYSETIPEIPANTDPIEWFLFDLKQGFCNYYASAEVLLLRSIGIPARMAIGYAQGEFLPNEGFQVRVKDSHAWPEVFFPGIGWVEFEPTASQPETFRLEGGDDSDNETGINPDPFFPPGGEEGAFSNLDDIEEIELGGGDTAEDQPFRWFWIGGLLVILAAALYLWLRWHPEWIKIPLPLMLEKRMKERGAKTPRLLQSWARMVEGTPIERIFMTIQWMLWVLGKRVVGGLTPAEQMAVLVETVPEADESARTLLEEYQRAIYSKHAYDLDRATVAYRNLLWLVSRSWTKRALRIQGT
jgi:transglutaminase-like putative cysteine protease